MNKILALFVLVIAALAAIGGTVSLFMSGEVVLGLANGFLAFLAWPTIKDVFDSVFNDD